MTSERSWSEQAIGFRPPRSGTLRQTLSLAAVASGSMLAIGIILRHSRISRRIDRLLKTKPSSLEHHRSTIYAAVSDGSISTRRPRLGFSQCRSSSRRRLGDSEYSLRLFPFAAGTLALVLMVFLARAVVSPFAVPFSVVFAFSEPLIGYTTSNKQYAVDVLMTVVVLLVGLRYKIIA